MESLTNDPTTTTNTATATATATPAANATAVPTPLIPPSSIRPATTLHLTLGVLSLPTPSQVLSAISLLHSLDLAKLLSESSPSSPPPPPPAAAAANTNTNTNTNTNASNTNGDGDGNDAAVPPPPLKISLKGLSAMHSDLDPSKTSVLYATPTDPTSRLQPFCARVRRIFADAGYILPSPGLVLHATIVNTIYARARRRPKRGCGDGRGKGRGKMTIDARGVVERYAGYEWMRDVRVERVGICEMGAREVGGEGEVRYVEVAGREMP
ncbi:MAG: hypothetical protein M1830_010771 [Pleopsidium flavum]|nr:MAG: hypothetical protein M1830_010771 [Pleopsidium flavum]